MIGWKNRMKSNIPNKLEFCAKIDLETYLLKKSGNGMVIEYFPYKSKKPVKININKRDFQEIWDKIKKLDFQRYQNITEKDMEVILSQPGESVSQFIKIIIDGKIMVKKELFILGPEMILNNDLTELLSEINNLLAEKFRKNSKIKK